MPSRTNLLGRLAAAALVVTVVATGLVAGLTSTASAGPGTPTLDTRFYNVGQADSRWAATKMYGDEYIGRCGCQLAAYTSMVWREVHAAPNVLGGATRAPQPFFPTQVNDHEIVIDVLGWRRRQVISTTTQSIFSPHYFDQFLRRPDPVLGRGENWGYIDDSGVDVGCGSPPHPWALEVIGTPSVVTFPGPDGSPTRFDVGASGVAIDIYDGLDTDLIDRNLLAGQPTIVGRKYVTESGEPGGHYQIITGWDAERQRYRINDPAAVSGSSPIVIDKQENYDRWLGEIVRTVDVRPAYGHSQHLVVHDGGAGDGAAPLATDRSGEDEVAELELTAVLPDGRLAGYDADTGERVTLPGNYMYEELVTGPLEGLEGPPATTAPGRPARALMTTSNPVGVTRTLATATSSGPYAIELFDLDTDGRRTDLGTVTGTATEGEEIKHQVTYADDGSATAVEVDDFSPEVVLDPPSAVAGEPVTLDGSGSFDVDGEITSWDWDLGDGTTADEETVAHTWDRPGTYAVTLTVADDAGQTSSETVDVTVTPSETDAPALTAHVDPASGWSDGPVTVELDGTDAGTGVESITTSAEGAEEIAETTVEGDRASVTVEAEGRSTVRARATDRMGNVSGSETVDVGVDTTGPSTAVLTPPDGRTTSGLAVLGGTASDPLSGVASVEVRLQRPDGRSWDGTTWIEAESWIEATGTDTWAATSSLPTGSDLAEGDHTVTARATDLVGNQGDPSPPVTTTVGAVDGGLPVTELAPPGDRSASTASDVGVDGQAVGTAQRLGLTDSLAVRWDGAGAPGPLPVPAGMAGAEAVAVNAHGTVAGWSSTSLAQLEATLWVDGEPVRLGAASGAGQSVARDVDDRGVAVGSSTYDPRLSRQRAARFADGTVELIGDLGGATSEATASNEVGDVVGWSTTSDGSSTQRAFVLPSGVDTAQALPELDLAEDPDAVRASIAYDVNDLGTAVGTDSGRAVRWEGGSVVDLGDGEAFAVDEAGVAVGLRYVGDALQATLWGPEGPVDLNALIDPGTGWTLERAEGISDDGRYVTGSGSFRGEPRGWVLDLRGGGGSGDDTVAPTTTVEGPSGWVDHPVDLAYSATDDSSEVASIATSLGVVDGPTGTVTVAAEGESTVVHSATDRAGNVEPPGETVVRIDTVAPVASVSSPAAGWHPGPVSVDVGGTDRGSGVATLRVRVDDGPARDVAPGPFVVDQEGEHTVAVVAVDRAGNESEPVTTTVAIDGTGPSVELLEPVDGPTVDLGTPVFASAVDAGSGLASLELALVRDDVRRPFAVGGRLTSVGPVEVEAVAEDAVGNTSRATFALEVTSSEPAPDLDLPGSPPTAVLEGPISVDEGELFELDASRSSDPDGDELSYEWFLEGTPMEGGAVIPTRLEEGTHQVTVQVSDGSWSSVAHTLIDVGPAGDPDPEDPDPEDPGPEDPGPENPGPEDPGPEDPGPEDPGPEDPGPEAPDPEEEPAPTRPEGEAPGGAAVDPGRGPTTADGDAPALDGSQSGEEGTPAPSSALPRTGSDLDVLAILGALLLLCGAVVATIMRRMAPHTGSSRRPRPPMGDAGAAR